jgi:hypothetical protein
VRLVMLYPGEVNLFSRARSATNRRPGWLRGRGGRGEWGDGGGEADGVRLVVRVVVWVTMVVVEVSMSGR